ncbi:MAG: phosphoserine phosphatase SerB [Microbacteriaceae bacterium]
MSRFLVVCDVDSTLINDEVIELFAEVAGVRDRVADVTERAMRGELDFAESLRERVSTLAGLTEGVFPQVLERITPTPGVTELIAAVHAADGLIIAVSGGFHEILDPLATAWNLDWWTANRFEKFNGMLTGRTHGPVIDAAAKEHALRTYAAENGIPLDRTIAVGDGANDLKMMSAAGLSVAFCAKPVVAEQATVSIVERDLTQVIPLFGRLS